MSSTNAEFCDTNLLVYAHSRAAGPKHQRARELVARLWREGTGTISIQVLQELFVILTSKVSPPIAPEVVREILADLSTWRVIEPTKEDVLSAIDAAQRWQISFWDAMIVTAANKAGADVLWTEDLNHGQQYGATTVRNPFLPWRAR